jgi:dihydrofolate reductase
MMRPITVMNRITLDGFFDGPNGENDWFIPDGEVDKAVHEMVPTSDRLLFGRATYQHMERFWPTVTDAFPEPVREMAKEMNGMLKLVFSRTLKQVPWENSQIMTGDLIEEVTHLKQGDGAGLLIFGSGSLVQPLTDAGLIDHYVFILTPTVLGQGKPQFKQNHKVDLTLVETRSFKTGNVVLHYTLGK